MFQELLDRLRALESWETFQDDRLWLRWIERSDDWVFAVIVLLRLGRGVFSLHSHEVAPETEMVLSERGM